MVPPDPQAALEEDLDKGDCTINSKIDITISDFPPEPLLTCADVMIEETGPQSDIVQTMEIVHDSLEIMSEEVLPSSTTNECESLEEVRVAIVEDDNTVYITILDEENGGTPPPLDEIFLSNDTVEIAQANPYFSQHLYKSTYTAVSLRTDTDTKTLYDTITFPEVKVLKYTSNTEMKKPSTLNDIEFKSKKIGESAYTMPPTNCNYINHVHWTMTYPMAFQTQRNSHKYMCVLRELYQKKMTHQVDTLLTPLDMRCDSSKLPQTDVLKMSRLMNSPRSPRATSSSTAANSHLSPAIPLTVPQPLTIPVSKTTPAAERFDNLYKHAYRTTQPSFNYNESGQCASRQYQRHNHHHSQQQQSPHQQHLNLNSNRRYYGQQPTAPHMNSNHRSSCYNQEMQVGVAQPVNVAYARRYMEMKPPTDYSRPRPQKYRMPPNLEKLWNTTKLYTEATKSKNMPMRLCSSNSNSSKNSFIDIPIRSPTFNLDLPPIRIPINQFTENQQKGRTLPPVETFQGSDNFYNNADASILKDFLTVENYNTHYYDSY